MIQLTQYMIQLTQTSSGSWPLRANASHKRWLALAAAAGCLLTLSACGSDPVTSTSSDAAAPSKSALPGWREFGLTDEEFAQHIEKTQSVIAKCMADAGFEYIPVDVQTVEAAQARVRTDPGYTRQSYKEKWGLAVTTREDNPVQETGLGPNNLQIMANLSEADLVAYKRTLFGKNEDADFVWTFDEEDFSETGGCTREGIAAAFTKEQLKGTYVNPKDVLLEADPRIIEADRNWVECMRGYGYDYKSDQDEIIDEFGERLEELLDGDEMAELTGARKAALEQLRQEEIKVSLADLDCQIKFTDDVFKVVETEIYGRPISG